MRGREGPVVGKGIQGGGDSLGRDQGAAGRRGQQGREGKSQRSTGDGRGRGKKTVVGTPTQ